MNIAISDIASVKYFLKVEYHHAYDEFVADLERLDDDETWAKHYNNGDFQDKAKVPFQLLTSSDETYYCMQNGYFNDVIFNDAFHALDTAVKIDFIDDWCEEHGQ